MVTALTPFGLVPAQATGELVKDSDGYYLISDYEGLKAFAAMVNNGETGGNSYIGFWFILMTVGAVAAASFFFIDRKKRILGK